MVGWRFGKRELSAGMLGVAVVNEQDDGVKGTSKGVSMLERAADKWIVIFCNEVNPGDFADGSINAGLK